MARIEIRTLVPANTEVAHARTTAKLAAAEQLKLQVVEETLLPVNPRMMVPNPENSSEALEIDTPNDHTVDRELVTFWDFHA